MELYDLVRVKQVSPTACSNAWAVNRRAPRVGDCGAIVDVLFEQGKTVLYVVECVDLSGGTIWIGEFAPDEIERIPRTA